MQAIYAIDSMGGLAKNKIIPWYSKKDLTFFKSKTKSNVVIMGKNTFLSLPNGYLPNRLNIILTTNPDDSVFKNTNDKFVIVTSDNLIGNLILQNKDKWIHSYPYLSNDFKIFFIGGKKIYEQFIMCCDTVWVTQIKKDYQCDLFFNFDYSKEFEKEIIDSDNELTIIKYKKN